MGVPGAGLGQECFGVGAEHMVVQRFLAGLSSFLNLERLPGPVIPGATQDFKGANMSLNLPSPWKHCTESHLEFMADNFHISVLSIIQSKRKWRNFQSFMWIFKMSDRSSESFSSQNIPKALHCATVSGNRRVRLKYSFYFTF